MEGCAAPLRALDRLRPEFLSFLLGVLIPEAASSRWVSSVSTRGRSRGRLSGGGCQEWGAVAGGLPGLASRSRALVAAALPITHLITIHIVM
eukprot:366575-Chlamydomonas_euryale.AAC.7